MTRLLVPQKLKENFEESISPTELVPSFHKCYIHDFTISMDPRTQKTSPIKSSKIPPFEG